MSGYKKICTDTEKAVSETAKYILRESGNFIITKSENKGHNDFVSYVDKGSEKMLVEKLGRILPEAGFITEEGTSAKEGPEFCWVIDPLDGTTNFLHGLHPYAISVALTRFNKPVIGIVYEISGSEVFTAWEKGGAYLNGKPIHVSSAAKLSDSLIATGFPYSDFSRLDRYMDTLAYLCRNSHGVRRLGSASIDLAYVACGRFEGFWEYGLHTWDVTAGALLVREAGGFAGDFSGDGDNLSGREIIAANNLVFSEFLEIVSKFMQK